MAGIFPVEGVGHPASNDPKKKYSTRNDNKSCDGIIVEKGYALNVHISAKKKNPGKTKEEQKKEAIKLKYFVIHDIGASNAMGEKGVEQYKNDKKTKSNTHAFIMPDGQTKQVNDWGNKKVCGTKRERKKYGKWLGQMIHFELNMGIKKERWNNEKVQPGDGQPSEAQYKTLAEWYRTHLKTYGDLIIVSHLEVDRGIKGGHRDPRNFDWSKFYGLLGINERGLGSNGIQHWDAKVRNVEPLASHKFYKDRIVLTGQVEMAEQKNTKKKPGKAALKAKPLAKK